MKKQYIAEKLFKVLLNANAYNTMLYLSNILNYKLMKPYKLLSMFLILFINLITNGQIHQFRVEKILTINDNGENKIDTLISIFKYDEKGILKKISKYSSKGNEVDEENFIYEGNFIKVFDRNKTLLRYYELDSSGRVTAYKNGVSRLTFFYNDFYVQKIVDNQKIEGENYIYTYDFKFSSNQLITKVAFSSNSSKINYKSGDYDFYFYYNRDPKTLQQTTLKRVDKGKPSQYLPYEKRFLVKWENDKITELNAFLPVNKLSEGRKYKYDEFGNVIEEEIKRPNLTGGFKTTRYIVTYSENAGNDYIIWSVSNWIINKLFNQRTFNIYTMGYM